MLIKGSTSYSVGSTSFKKAIFNNLLYPPSKRIRGFLSVVFLINSTASYGKSLYNYSLVYLFVRLYVFPVNNSNVMQPTA